MFENRQSYLYHIYVIGSWFMAGTEPTTSRLFLSWLGYSWHQTVSLVAPLDTVKLSYKLGFYRTWLKGLSSGAWHISRPTGTRLSRDRYKDMCDMVKEGRHISLNILRETSLASNWQFIKAFLLLWTDNLHLYHHNILLVYNLSLNPTLHVWINLHIIFKKPH